MAGSPPRVRGPPRVAVDRAGVRGITPACAGTTSLTSRRPCPARDHPRVCGDHYAYSQASHLFMGSPPRVRGPLHLLHARVQRAGITPACAGTTRSVPVRMIGHRDHPRVCGDHSWWVRTASAMAGSPPRVRGPHAHKRQRLVLLGITPACAGTTLADLRLYSVEGRRSISRRSRRWSAARTDAVSTWCSTPQERRGPARVQWRRRLAAA